MSKCHSQAGFCVRKQLCPHTLVCFDKDHFKPGPCISVRGMILFLYAYWFAVSEMCCLQNSSITHDARFLAVDY